MPKKLPQKSPQKSAQNVHHCASCLKALINLMAFRQCLRLKWAGALCKPPTQWPKIVHKIAPINAPKIPIKIAPKTAKKIAPKITFEIISKINFPVCIDQLTGNSSMLSFEMDGSPLQAINVMTENRPQNCPNKHPQNRPKKRQKICPKNRPPKIVPKIAPKSHSKSPKK